MTDAEIDAQVVEFRGDKSHVDGLYFKRALRDKPQAARWMAQWLTPDGDEKSITRSTQGTKEGSDRAWEEVKAALDAAIAAGAKPGY